MPFVIRSPRHAVLSSLAKAIKVSTEAPKTGDDDKIPLPDIGDMQMFAFFEPGLQAGEYHINVTQDVTFKDNLLPNLIISGENDTAQQPFEVVAPQFVIPPADIHSTYPPQGHADQPNVLPHIVFNDPHLPWERPMVQTAEDLTDQQDLQPWLAVFPFDCNGADLELRLNASQLNGSTAIYSMTDDKGQAVELAQSSSFTLSMTVKDYLALPDKLPTGATKVHIPAFSSREDFSDIVDDPTPVEVIFLSGKLFKALFPLGADQKPDLSQYRFCSHVRNVNTGGMVNAGVEDTGLFSILHSRRTSPTNIAQNTAPRSQVVHLISLELVDGMTGVDTMEDDELVAFVSLYHWTYLCQPPLSVNFVDAMRAIGDQVNDPQQSGYLRCPETIINTLQKDIGDTTAKIQIDPKWQKITTTRTAMLGRLINGYSLVRYRVQSGEETVALSRGALLPVTPTLPIDSWPFSSNNGQDYQIFDPELGLMDVSYSSAWQLGKTLASSDMGFVAALMRVRAAAHEAGERTKKLGAANETIGLNSKMTVMSRLPNTLSTLDHMTKMSSSTVAAPNLAGRWSHAASATTLQGPLLAKATVNKKALFSAGVARNIAVAASHPGTDGTQPTPDLFETVSTDWKFVHEWILDRMFLSGIPTHYLIGDPSFLPPESIRFFHIDKIWMDCYIDGALSVANHMQSDDDVIRNLIKHQFNQYLKSKIKVDPRDPNSAELHNPQVPIYGFFLRSAVCTIFPSLIIEAPFLKGAIQGGRAEICLQKPLGKDIIMILLDRLPEGRELDLIRFTQPPHQQRFSAGDFLDDKKIEFLFRKVYPELVKADGTPHDDFLHEFGDAATFLNGKSDMYNWTSRCLNFERLQDVLFNDTTGLFTTILNDEWAPDVRPFKLTSAMAGLQLNDTIKYLELMAPRSSLGPLTDGQKPYQIRAKDPVDGHDEAAELINSIKKAETPVKSTSATKPSNQPSATTTPQSLPTHTIKPTSTTRSSSSPPLITPTQSLPPADLPKSPLRSAQPHNPSLPLNHFHAPVLDAAISPRRRTPMFDYAIYPSTTLYAPKAAFIHTNNPYPADLIFSINLRDPDSLLPGLFLRFISFTIPIGPSAARIKAPNTPGELEGPGLAPVAACGDRGRMLSNQRWVVHLDPGPKYLVVRLIPRSLQLRYPLEVNRELGFRLEGVDTAWDSEGGNGAQEPGNVKVLFTENYGQDSDGDQGGAADFIRVARTQGFVEAKGEGN